MRTLALAAVGGGAVGATLLLLTPSDTFEKIAPWLIGVASLAILLRPRVHAGEPRAAGRAERRRLPDRDLRRLLRRRRRA